MPFVQCLQCGHETCFTHAVSWHENLSCLEYDQIRANPDTFRTRQELEEAEGERLARLAAALAVDEEAQRQAEGERREHEEARAALALQRAILVRQKREDDQSEVTMAKTSKPCPGCGWAIEKQEGW